ncbi:MAG TPA: terminase TerL endonuclease subunit [Symbiobacteriaceae bacterium]|jgi:phage terminase large subunit-like protein
MPDLDATTQYALDVAEGRIIAGNWVRLACERHLRDIDRQGTDGFPYVFDIERAERVFDFFGFCRHVEGELAGEPIILAPFQKFIFGSVFGWVHKDTGYRRFRKAYIQLGRKNGKSTSLSGIGLYMLMADRPPDWKTSGHKGEPGSQVYATATKKDQARIVYDSAKVMVQSSPDLLKRLEPGRDKIYHLKSNSKFVPLSKDTKSLDGFNPHFGIIDEYHAHRTDEMYNLLVKGMAKRRQPLLMIITTAGHSLNCPCYKEYSYLCKTLDGTLPPNERYFAYIAQLDKDDDIKDSANWAKANPLLADDSFSMEFLQTELDEALDDPRKMRDFMTKSMNVWVDQREDGYMPMLKWKACKVDIMPDLKGRECHAGVDLSARIDLTSVAFEFDLGDGKFAVLSHSFMPAETVAAHRKSDKVPYDKWIKDGWITETEGAQVDQRLVMQYIQDQVAANGWIVKELCFDQWSATNFANEMTDKGYKVVEIVQGMKTLSEPTKDFRALVLSRMICHDGNEVLTWAMSNALTREDHNRNMMLDKAKSVERIDPVAALMNAHVRAMLKAPPTRSIYETRGVISI